MGRRHALHLVLALGTLAAASLSASIRQEEDWDLARPDPRVMLHPAQLSDLDSYDCATCHAEVVQEWAATAHGLSWADEHYQAAVQKKRRPELCYGCHIPEPLLVAGLEKRPRPREQARQLGISCESCHEGPDGVMLGPRGEAVAAHATQRSEYMIGAGSNALCAACHSTNIGPVIGVAKDFVASGQAERGRSCVGCHMAKVERRWAEVPGDDATIPVRLGRSHALQTPRDPAFLRRAFAVEWRTSGKRSRVVLKNRAGHRVPGLIGRELTFRAELLDDAGAVVERAELVLDAQSYLPVDGTVEIRLAESGARVHLVGEHIDPRADEPIPFLDERLSPTER